MQVGIVGGSGYIAGQLLRMLAFHKDIEIKIVSSKSHAGEKLSRVHPDLLNILDLRFSDMDPVDLASRVDLVFLALPHGTSINYVPDIYEIGTKIIDMSADFRLKDPDLYREWYGFEHNYPDLLEKFVYGMPEFHRNEIKNSRYVSVPGCIASSTIYSVAPFSMLNLDNNIVTVDAKVGSSGSGSGTDSSKNYSERYNSVRAYKPVHHRHTPEIEQEIKYISGKNIKIAMSAHSVNMVRGILTTSNIFIDLDEPDALSQLREFYKNEKFIRLIFDRKSNFRYPDPKTVIGTNFADLGVISDGYIKRIVSLGAIDNMIKGAAGNAIQSMNIMNHFDESEGLLIPAAFPV
ncbi:N-acetyl-gamma-glutamyl-phosphate reductase [Picrophilus oshimae]|uniref:Putative [LysW]-L-2-aminoadipate/[LysW]-L-glutamate phosphate reductase n=1 Tax=Picrophilus torridus (strain ATCC 700027 / DSM 9790 / JCM 10055 / NBRC 100828 / KAW 2/3) TaxID=1122961 RepID=LYSY_PICTO|nr:N-acetyl-gamma-glutamyl-phosphate reductase [Picrophilus oshimae]Q6KYZ5.1 RecName: Full=Putative [LysW]-L-2-aminoadipate/[LysW]-L-glutamate phosphate reductase [Picrophilus oshimae DSM 9789]AAT44057.1 N-acetyl-gamma-glutamyl-phosphate reductase [Picrophilus oshimae DSM 9789]